MVKRVILGRTGEEKIVDLIKAIDDKASAGHTTPAGTKVLDDDEDMIWSRPDGTEHSVRDIDEELEGARQAIEEAQVEFERADQELAEAKDRLEVMETETLPAAVQALEAADAAAQQELTTLDGKLATARQDLVAVGENIGQLETDLATESDAREQLAQDVQGTFTELDTRLGAFATDEALAPIRQALTDAQDAVETAQGVAQAANQAANAASQAALEAAGIAASKGRVIIQETEPVGEDRNAANIWIKPIPDNPDTEIEEKAITYVYLEGSNEWVPTSSDELAQAAQNALDAREAAQQAQQRADTAIANAAAAQAAAEAAQRTADDATLDAREAHNEAVAAQEAASAIRDDMASGPSLWPDPSFERSRGGLPGPGADDLYPGRIERSQDWAASGDWSVKYTASGNGGNNYGAYKFGDLTPGHWYAVSATVHAGEHEQAWNTTWDARTAPVQSAENLGFLVSGSDGKITVGPGETKTDTWFFQAPEGGVAYRFWAGQLSTHNRAEHEGQVVYVDDFRLVDVTDTYPQYLAAQQAAQDAQDRADEAYTEAASKATPAEVQAAANAAEQAAKTAAAADAKAKADQAKADALAGAATDAKSKADAAEAAAIAAASADAATKANKALQDALAALATARGEITAEIKASANGKNSITVSTSNPSGSGVAIGDTWWRVDASGDIFGQWMWNGSWVPREIRSEVIAHLDVHKLTGTSGEFETFFAENFTANNAVVEQLWADQLAAKVVTAQQVTVAPGNSFPDPGGLNVGTRNSVGGPIWSWNESGKYWRSDANAGGTSQFNAYLNTTTGYDSGSLTPGETYRIAYDIWHNGSNASQRVRSAIYYRRTDNSTSFTADGATAGFTTPGEWHRVERSWTAPNDAVSGGFTFQLIYTPSDATEVRIRNPFIGVKAGAVSIKNGAVSADHVNAESVAGAVGEFVEAEVGNLKATQGTIGNAVIDKIWADGIAAKSVTTSSITVARGNILPNGQGELGDNTYWNDFTYVPDAPAETGAVGGFRSADSGFEPVLHAAPVPIEAGREYLGDVWIHRALAGGDTAIAFDFVDASGNYMARNYAIWPKGMPAGLSHHEATFTPPAGATHLRFNIVPNHSNGTSSAATFYGLRVRPKASAVLIEDGAITTPKLNVTEQMTAKFAEFTSAETKKLYVTEELVAEAVNIPGKMLIGKDRATSVFTGDVAFENIDVTGELLADTIMADKGLVAGGPDGQVVIDGAGVTRYEIDSDGQQIETFRLGPQGGDIATFGDTTISPTGVGSPEGAFDQLSVGGEDLGTILSALPRGMRAWGTLEDNSKFDSDTTKFARRAELQTTLLPDRLYRVRLSSHMMEVEGSMAATVRQELRYSLDQTNITTGISPDSGRAEYTGAWIRHRIRNGTPRSASSLEFLLDTGGWTGERHFWVMYMVLPEQSDRPVRIVARSDYPMILAVEDVGPSQAGLLKRWNDGSGLGTQDPAPTKRRYTKTYTSTSFHTYDANGNQTSDPDVVQGLYAGGPSRLRRRGGWKFPSFTNDLSGATVEKIEAYVYMNHSYYSAGADVNIATHNGTVGTSLTSRVTVRGWKRNTGKWVTLPKSLYNGFKNGTYRGVGVISTNSTAQQYARFNGSGAKVRITYVK